jgi:hypothetical protein
MEGTFAQMHVISHISVREGNTCARGEDSWCCLEPLFPFPALEKNLVKNPRVPLSPKGPEEY